jgi:hypothetical protein
VAVTHNVIGDTIDAIEKTLEGVFATKTTIVTVLQDSDETTQERVLEIASMGPTVVVAWTGTESGTYSARPKSMERFAVGVWAGPVPSAKRDERTSALKIASRVGRIVADTVLGNDWGVDGVDKAADFQCDNLSGGVPDAEGYALLVITWKQSIDFPDAVDPSTLEDLESVYSTVTVPDSPDGLTKDEFDTEIPQD